MIRLFCSLFFLTIFGCSRTPEPIQYGTDSCHFCKMTIVSKTHAAQLVTSKGKQFKFDAPECMIRYVHKHDEKIKGSDIYVSDYQNPGTMLDAKKASFLISPTISSPMGANLSAFSSMALAKKQDTSSLANFYNWTEIIPQINP